MTKTISGKNGKKVFNDDGTLQQADSFVFYRTWHQTGQEIEDLQERLAYYQTIFEYGLYGKEPSEDCPLSVKLTFHNIKYQLDSQIKNALDGSAGGRPPKGKTDPEEKGKYQKMFGNNT